MKKVLFALLIGFTGTAVAQTGNYKLNSNATGLTWIGKKVTGEHTGTITPADGGTISLKNGNIKNAEVVIDMKSITCTDLEGEWNEKLVGHLHSDDFFSTAKYPEAKLKITKSEPLKEGNYTHQLTGELTIKGQTHPVTFPAVIEVKGNKLAAAGELKVDRTLYGIKYGSSNFFEGLGDKAIDNEFVLRFKLGATS